MNPHYSRRPPLVVLVFDVMICLERGKRDHGWVDGQVACHVEDQYA